MVSYVGDICEPETIERAFEGGVECVFHCAAYVNFQFPPNEDELERVNVKGEYFGIILDLNANLIFVFK